MLVQVWHFLDRPVEGERRPFGRQAFQEGKIKDVNGDATGPQLQAAVRATPGSRLGRQLAVLDDPDAAVDLRRDPELLLRGELRDNLQRHLRDRLDVVAEVGGVGDHYQRVVDLIIKEILNPPPGEVGEVPAGRECVQHSAVAVGAGRQAVLGGEEEPSRRAVQRRHGALDEEDHLVRVEPKPLVLIKERPGVGVVFSAGHDVEGQGRVVAPAQREHLFRVDLEQALARERPDGIRPLRAFKAQAGPLAARDQDDGHLAGLQCHLATGTRPPVPLAVLERPGEPQHGGRPHGLVRGRGGVGLAEQALQLLRVDARQLLVKALPLGLGQFGPPPQGVLLAASGQERGQRGVTLFGRHVFVTSVWLGAVSVRAPREPGLTWENASYPAPPPRPGLIGLPHCAAVRSHRLSALDGPSGRSDPHKARDLLGDDVLAEALE